MIRDHIFLLTRYEKKIHLRNLSTNFSGCFCFRFSTAQEHLGGFDVTLLRSQRWPSDVESATLDGVQSTPLSEDAWMKHTICGWDIRWTYDLGILGGSLGCVLLRQKIPLKICV